MTSFNSVFGANFDAVSYVNQNPDALKGGNFEPLPAGTYLLEVMDSELTTSKSGFAMLKLQFQVAEGEHVGRTVFTNLNIGHSNPKAKSIALQQLAQLCHGAGIKQLVNDTDLVGKRVSGRVTIRPAANGYPASNSISMFAAPGSETPVPAAAPAKSSVPWG